jgi:hypothetical protein
MLTAPSVDLRRVSILHSDQVIVLEGETFGTLLHGRTRNLLPVQTGDHLQILLHIHVDKTFISRGRQRIPTVPQVLVPAPTDPHPRLPGITPLRQL